MALAAATVHLPDRNIARNRKGVYRAGVFPSIGMPDQETRRYEIFGDAWHFHREC
jgi:hypothetical protein